MSDDFSDTREIVRRQAAGDRGALEELFSRHRDRLRWMVRLRLDPRLRSRIDESDVIQDVYLEATRRLPEYVRDPVVPFFIWLRSLTGQQLVNLHRHHLGVQARDPRREISMNRASMPQVTSAVLAAQLLGDLTTPSEKVIRWELESRVREALESMDPKDREVLLLRHFENLTNSEIASELGVGVSTASKRYVRALTKLKAILVGVTGFPGETWKARSPPARDSNASP